MGQWLGERVYQTSPVTWFLDNSLGLWHSLVEVDDWILVNHQEESMSLWCLHSTQTVCLKSVSKVSAIKYSQLGIKTIIQSARYQNYHTVNKVSELSYNQQSINGRSMEVSCSSWFLKSIWKWKSLAGRKKEKGEKRRRERGRGYIDMGDCMSCTNSVLLI